MTYFILWTAIYVVLLIVYAATVFAVLTFGHKLFASFCGFVARKFREAGL